MLKKLAEEILKKISEQNSHDSINSIPHSDVFLKEMQSMFGIRLQDLRKIISILKESNKILCIEIIKEDKDKEISKVEGYVEAVLETITRLKHFFQKTLLEDYERQHNNKLLLNQIIRETFLKPTLYKNTTIGQLANKAIMLEEYENLLMKNSHEYTDAVKSRKFNDIFNKTEFISPEKVYQRDESIPKETLNIENIENKEHKEHIDSNIKKSSNRATDLDNFNGFMSDKTKKSLEKILEIYGVEFFIRVNLRKYNFNLLIKLIESGEINKKADMKLLKSMIKKIKENFDKDKELDNHKEEIIKLERLLSLHIV